MVTYKIWLYVEEHDEEEDTYNDIGEPEDVAEFNSLNEAQNFIATLTA